MKCVGVVDCGGNGEQSLMVELSKELEKKGKKLQNRIGKNADRMTSIGRKIVGKIKKAKTGKNLYSKFPLRFQ